MTHLGDRVAPLIDGELPLDASERAMTHMASCASCTEAVDLERLTKQRLASLGTPQPGTDFMQRLLTLGVTEGSAGPRPPQPGGYLAGGTTPSVLAPSRSVPPAMPPFGSSTRPPGRRTVFSESRPTGVAPWGPSRRASRTTRNRLVFAAVGAACLMGVGVAGSVSAAPHQRGVTPAVDSLVRQYSSTSLTSQFGRQFTGQAELVGVARGGR